MRGNDVTKTSMRPEHFNNVWSCDFSQTKCDIIDTSGKCNFLKEIRHVKYASLK